MLKQLTCLSCEHVPVRFAIIMLLLADLTAAACVAPRYSRFGLIGATPPAASMCNHRYLVEQCTALGDLVLWRGPRVMAREWTEYFEKLPVRDWVSVS